MRELSEKDFLRWTGKRGLVLDPRYPESQVLAFAGGERHARFWAVPSKPARIPYFVSTILRLLGDWSSCYVWKHLGSWPGDPDETRINHQVQHRILKGVGVPVGSASVLEFARDELADLVAVVFTQLIFGWCVGDDLYVVPDHAGSIVQTDHHDVVHVSCREEDQIQEFIRDMEEQGFPPLPRRKPDTVDRTSSMGLWTHAREFVNAARAVVEKSRGPMPTAPAYFLYGHAIELALKAFLRGSGMTLDELRRIGHDLDRAVTEARTRDLDSYYQVQPEDLEAIRLTNLYYRAKEFEYIRAGFKRWPEIGYLEKIAESLLRSIHAFCKENRERHTDANGP